MKLTPITAFSALVLIGLGGYMAGRASSSGQPDNPKDSPAETRSSRYAPRDSSDIGGETKRSARPSKADSLANGMTPDRLTRLESIVRGENPLDRNRALLAFIDQLAPGDFEEAVAGFRNLGITESRLGEYSLLLTAWAQADPLSALTYAKANTRSNFAADTILTSWATRDPEAAIRWAEADYQGDGANPYMPGIIRGLVETDPVRATDLLAALPRSEERGQGLDYMLPHLLRQGTEATQAWIAAITDESLRNGAMLRTARNLADNDPAGTVDWLLANPGEATQRRMDDVYSVWAKKDQQAALSSLNTLPAGDIRSNALRGVVSSVAAADPTAALNLMDTYPNDVNDRMVQHFIWNSFDKDPATAANQINRIADERDRERMYRRALDAWYSEDPTAAAAWTQTNAIPDSVREHLTRRQQNP